MSASLSFEKPAASCDACGATHEPAQLSRVALALRDPPLEATLCAECRALVWDPSPEPTLPPPRLRAHPGFRLPLVTDVDLDALFRDLASTLPPRDLDVRDFLERCRHGGAADLDPYAQSLSSAGPSPHEARFAGALLMAARLRMVLAPTETLDRFAMRSEGDTVPLCLGIYYARHAEPVTLSTTDERSRKWLSRARQQLLTASPKVLHPMYGAWVCLRTAVDLALGNAASTRSMLMRAPKNSMRTRLHTGLAAMIEGNHAAADRELHAAMSDPLAAADPDYGKAALWNHAVRAISATRWDGAVAALANLCKLDPGDLSARLLLAHGWLRRSGERVAREVTASVFDESLVARLRRERSNATSSLSERLDGVILHAAMLLRAGDHGGAGRALEEELRDLDALPAELDRAEIERMRWRVAWHSHDSVIERTANSMAHAQAAVELDPTAEVSREATWLWLQAALAAIERGGIAELVDFANAHAGFEAAIQRTLGIRQSIVTCLLLVQQIDSEFRPVSTLGLDWSQRRLRGADAISSHVQCFSSLAAHQLAIALQHARRAVGQQGGFLPLSLLGAVVTAFRAAEPMDRARFRAALSALLERLFRGADGPPD
ncbi:MAG: hypothetical protein AB7I19_09875 [Planctomycetota bacterium]